MDNFNFSNIEWDDAQQCEACHKTFLVQGMKKYDKCPDCGGAVYQISTKQADEIEQSFDRIPDKFINFFGKKMFSSVFEHLASDLHLTKDSKIKQCTKCQHLFTDQGTKDFHHITACPKCTGPLEDKTFDQVFDALKSNSAFLSEMTKTRYEVRCMKCGNMTMDDENPKFCSNCGAKLLSGFGLTESQPTGMLGGQSDRSSNSLQQVAIVLFITGIILLAWLILR